MQEALIKYPSSTPGQRHQLRVNRNWFFLQGNNQILATKGPKISRLLKGLTKSAGRNNHGRITVQGKGGGNKHSYRIIKYKNDLHNIPGIVKRIEYDPNRTAYIALIVYYNNFIAYQIATKGLEVGQVIMTGLKAPLIDGNRTTLFSIPIGTKICLIEILPLKGASLCRSAGTFAIVINKNLLKYRALIQLNSGIYKNIALNCYATLGQISNIEHKNEVLGKAGVSRWKNFRPKVRGVAKNPIDHPHGGGQGKTSGGRPSVTPFGIPTKGYKTRKKPYNFSHNISAKN